MDCEGCKARDKAIRLYLEQITDLQIELLKTLWPQETNDMRAAGVQSNPMFDVTCHD